MSEMKGWECVAAEFGEDDNAGLVAFWVRMPEPSICKTDADKVSAAWEMYEALKLAQDAWDTKSAKKNAAAWKAMKAALAKAEGRTDNGGKV